MEDLFENQEALPGIMQMVMKKYEDGDFTYEVCEELLDDCESFGYTFEYGLDAIPHSLTEMTLIPVHVNKARSPTHFYSWDSSAKCWMRGEELNDQAKELFGQPLRKKKYKLIRKN
jgi:hypothetical protein